MSVKYVIPGDPGVFVRMKSGNRREWDHAKHLKHACGAKLEEQLGKDKPFRGPLHIEVFFFLPPASRSTKLLGAPYTLRPTIASLLKYFEEVGGGILYEDNATIVSLVAHKKYDREPRTEIYVSAYQE